MRTIAALNQKQTDRLNFLVSKAQLTPEEKAELNILQKVESGEDTDADNPRGDNNPEKFEDQRNANEASLTDEERAQHDRVQSEAGTRGAEQSKPNPTNEDEKK